LRVGIDYLPASTHAPGVGRYARELVRALVRLADRDGEGDGDGVELRLLEFGRARCLAEYADDNSLGLAGGPHSAPFRRTLRLPRRTARVLGNVGASADRLLGGVDLFQHVSTDVLPVARARQVLPLFETPPEGTPADARLRAALARTDHVFVFSWFMEAVARERFGVPAHQVHRLPVGCDHWLRDALPAFERSDPPQVIVLGAVRHDRHHLEILRACEHLHGNGRRLHLHVMGGRGDAASEFDAALAASPLRDDVTWDLPAERDLPGILARASLLVHLSAGEGTPVTPLEAFSFGLPVVASQLPAFQEALGEEARWIADTDPGHLHPSHHGAKRLADAIDRALTDNLDEQATARRRAIACHFTWDNAARETVQAWERIAAP